MKKQLSVLSSSVQVEHLESRALFSAVVHPAAAIAAATSTKLTIKAGELGQAAKFTVTEKNSGTGGAPVGTVALTVDGVAFQTLTLTAKSTNAKTITDTYTIPAGAGGTPFFFGNHTITADFTSSGSLPSNSTTGSFTVKEPKFKTTSDGLGIATITAGRGAAVRENETASVFYTGYLESDGTIFDNSAADGGTPLQVAISPTSQFITGFVEGVDGMKVGSTRVLLIPPSLGYGAAGFAPKIPGDAELVFLVTLEGIS